MLNNNEPIHRYRYVIDGAYPLKFFGFFPIDTVESAFTADMEKCH